MSTTIEECELVSWATMLIAVQAGVSHADARRLMRITAEQTDTPLEDVAELVVNGTVDFDAP